MQVEGEKENAYKMLARKCLRMGYSDSTFRSDDAEVEMHVGKGTRMKKSVLVMKREGLCGVRSVVIIDRYIHTFTYFRFTCVCCTSQLLLYDGCIEENAVWD